MPISTEHFETFTTAGSNPLGLTTKMIIPSKVSKETEMSTATNIGKDQATDSYSSKTLFSDNSTGRVINAEEKTQRLLSRIDKILLKLENNEAIDPRDVWMTAYSLKELTRNHLFLEMSQSNRFNPSHCFVF